MAPRGKDERNRTIVDRYRAGEGSTSIARSLGMTRQRVDQIVSREAPELMRDRRAAHLTATQREFTNRATVAKPCIICGYWVLRGPHRITCSKDCATIYFHMYKLLNPAVYNQQRQGAARRAIRRGEKLEWASKVLNGEAPVPSRRFYVPGSRRRRLARLLGLLPDRPKKGHLFP